MSKMTFEQKQFNAWYKRYRNSLKGDYPNLFPPSFVSAQDYVSCFNQSNHLKPCQYDWDPSPVDYISAKKVMEKGEVVNITHEQATELQTA